MCVEDGLKCVTVSMNKTWGLAAKGLLKLLTAALFT